MKNIKFISPKISKAANAKNIHPVYIQIAESLSRIEILQFIKIYNGRLCASNLLSDDKKKRPITKINQEGVVGVELLIHPEDNVIDFYSLTTSPKGYSRKIVESIIEAVSNDWILAVTMDWSSGFWNRMIKDYKQIVIL